MKRRWLGRSISIVGLLGAAVWLSSLLSCARSTQLVGIAIQPSGGTFGAVDPSIFFQFKALGTYIHPPKTVDITDQVNWQSDNPQVIQITAAGVASPSVNCGVAQVIAEMHSGDSDVVSNSVSLTVDGPASLGCTPAGAQPTLTVTLTGTGTVISSPGGIDCTAPSSCLAQFTAGTTVTLNAAPSGTATSVSWNGCSPGTNALTCSLVLESDTTVTATFQ